MEKICVLGEEHEAMEGGRRKGWIVDVDLKYKTMEFSGEIELVVPLREGDMSVLEFFLTIGLGVLCLTNSQNYRADYFT
jgi:hypothetical protein